MNLDSVKPYAKAIVAFITPGVAALVAAVQDASPAGSNISGPEWVGIFAVCVLTSGAVFAVPNRDPQGLKQAESVQPPEASNPAKPLLPGDDDEPTTQGGYWGGV